MLHLILPLIWYSNILTTFLLHNFTNKRSPFWLFERYRCRRRRWRRLKKPSIMNLVVVFPLLFISVFRNAFPIVKMCLWFQKLVSWIGNEKWQTFSHWNIAFFSRRHSFYTDMWEHILFIFFETDEKNHTEAMISTFPVYSFHQTFQFSVFCEFCILFFFSSFCFHSEKILTHFPFNRIFDSIEVKLNAPGAQKHHSNTKQEPYFDERAFRLVENRKRIYCKVSNSKCQVNSWEVEIRWAKYFCAKIQKKSKLPKVISRLKSIRWKGGAGMLNVCECVTAALLFTFFFLHLLVFEEFFDTKV